ncbi:molecular chaperone TorD family protein [Campylobacter sp. FMV-PI01]|uniref:Molecular chaperone TorD family protein n=1 Tax=Campylobacter portucalensis TaxID=2608384 RepID=A0A6L5WG10_9BACT|nr:molecular chaperone TorD family protein [Campylobacter portucalensis]MSN95954.1 molecular chaperone TorD family protein [Campylobacter portucalensis]
MNKNITIARSYYYEFFAIPFFFSENDTKFRVWKEELAYLKSSLLDEGDGKFFEILENFSFEEFKEEQNRLLFDYSYANVPLTASFYKDGRDDGTSKMIVINTLKKSKFRRDNNLCKDSEDFVGFIFYLMSSLLKEEVDKSNFLSTELFVNVVNEFIDEMIEFIKDSKFAKFFLALANLMESFFAFERSLLGITKPQKADFSVAKESIERQPYISKIASVRDKYDWSNLDI